MMLMRAKDLIEGSSELLRAEAELAGTRLRRVLVRLLVAMVLGLIVLIGIMLLIAGTTVLLAHQIGWALSLLTHGGAMLMLTSGIWFWHVRKAPGDGIESLVSEDATEEEAVEDKAEAKQQMSNAANPNANADESHNEPGFEKIKDEAIDFAMKNPAIVAGAAMLAISAIGPGRSIRLFAKGVTAAGLIKSALGAVQISPERDQATTDPDAQRGTHSQNSNKRNTNREPIGSRNGVPLTRPGMNN